MTPSEFHRHQVVASAYMVVVGFDEQAASRRQASMVADLIRALPLRGHEAGAHGGVHAAVIGWGWLTDAWPVLVSTVVLHPGAAALTNGLVADQPPVIESTARREFLSPEVPVPPPLTGNEVGSDTHVVAVLT
jgi:hypothetical protein